LLGSHGTHASPITLTFTATDASYSVNGQQLAGDFMVEFVADTANVVLYGGDPRIPAYLGLTGTITFDGFGTGTFAGAYVFNHQGFEVVGFGSNNTADMFDLPAVGVGLDTYGLTTDFGPVGSTGEIFALGQWRNVATTLGAVSVFSVRSGTFQAGAGTQPVPEPGMLMLLGLGLAALGSGRRGRGR
jgi:hypothetical protein